MRGKRKFKNIRNKTVLYTWLLSYVSVFLVSFITGFLIYIQGNDALIEQINTTYNHSLNQAVSRTDDFLIKLNYIASSVGSSKELSEFLSWTESSGNVPNYSYVALSRFLKSQKNTLPAEVEMIYFSAKGIDYIVSSNGILKTDDFFSTYYVDGNHDVKELLTKFSYAEYKITEESADFIYSFPLKETGVKPENFLVIKLKKDAFLNILYESVATEESNICIVDKSDNVILNNQKYQKDIERYELYSTNSSIKRGEFVTIVAKSQYNSWKYIAEIPVNVIKERMKDARMLLWYLSSFSLIFAAVVISYFLKKNYSGLMSVVNTAISVLPDEDNVQMNEYDVISNVLSDYQRYVRLVDNFRYGKFKSERDKILYKLIRDDFSDTVLTELQKYKFEFDTDMFLLVQIVPTESENIELEYSAEYDERITANESISSFILSNIFEELLSEYSLVYCTNNTDSLFMLINLNKYDGEKYREKLIEIFRYTDDFVKLNFGLSFNAFVSSEYINLRNTHEAYAQIVKVKKYCASQGFSGVVFCDEIFGNAGNIKSYKKNVLHIFEFVRKGDIESAKTALETVFNVLREDESIYDIQIFVFTVCYVAIDTVAEVTGGKISSSVAEIIDDVNKMAFSSTHTEYLREELSNLIVKISNVVGYATEDSADGADGDFIDKVKRYIDENYKNPDFYIKTIGEHFNKTPYYISNCFKNREKTSILNYISMLRIESAKELIKNTDNTLADIAESVGFNNFRNFNRTFKKIEGITPGQFRKLSQEE